MKKDKFNAISDEQFAAFIDGNASDAETDMILDAVESKEDLETLVLSLAAKRIADREDDEGASDGEEDLKDMPDPKSLSVKRIELRPFAPLPMTGFLGNETDDEDSCDLADEKKE